MALTIVAVLMGIYFALAASGALAYLREPGALRGTMLSLGFWGPLAVVVLMTVAIVVSPLPSATAVRYVTSAEGEMVTLRN